MRRGRDLAAKGNEKGRKADGLGFSGVLETHKNGVKQWHKKVSGDGKKATIHFDTERSREPKEVGYS